MTQASFVADLRSRAVIAIGGPDWQSFLQGLITQDVETLAPGEARFAGLLTPQGRLLFDLFVVGQEGGVLIDCVAERRDALIQRLIMYRLRAKVEIAASDLAVGALWGGPAVPPGWVADPRLPALGFRGYGAAPDLPPLHGEGGCEPLRADGWGFAVKGGPQSPTPVASRLVPPHEGEGGASSRVPEAAYEAHRLALGVPGPADWGVEATYPIEANFDLLNGIDFKKGCFVGQETTSRMKRRGAVKSRMTPIAFEGAPPAYGAELLAGTLRAGVALSGGEGAAMALLRLDRVDAGPLTLADGRPWRPAWPDWLKAGRGV
jgi:tRNA-modifying protein YgfZ